MRKTLVLAAAFAALAANAPPAEAGTYDVWSCAGPAGEPLPANGWTASASSGGAASSTCGRPGGVLWGGLDDREIPSGSFARWTFEAPKDTTVASVTIHRTAAASELYQSWWRSYFLFGDAPVVTQDYGLDLCVALSGPPHARTQVIRPRRSPMRAGSRRRRYRPAAS